MTVKITPVGSTLGRIQVGSGLPIELDTAGGLHLHHLNGGQLAGFRNKILNGRFTINQANAASRIATPNEYNYDQWYYDGTYLYQPIPTEDVQDGTYTLSWEGGSTAAWSLNSASSANQGGQSYTAVANGGQIVVSGHTNEHLWVRFQSDLLALDKVQLELGNEATPFEYRSHSQEQDLCEYFLAVGTAGGVSYASSGAAVQRIFATFRKQVRSTPSVSLVQIAGNASAPGLAGSPYLTGLQIGYAATGQGQDIVVVFRASARI